MKIAPVIVWLDSKTRTGEIEITVVTKDGKSRHYTEQTLPLSVYQAMRDNKCIMYAGKEPQRIIAAKEIKL